jgi:AbiV family abortive infection protein
MGHRTHHREVSSDVTEAKFRFTIELLREYSAAALQNAAELFEEASLLYEKGHFARAYFLAVASIEETGKALQAFDAQGRNLSDSAVTAKLRQSMEDHSQKIASAFIPILIATPTTREALMPAVDLMIHLKRGREPAMYTDIRYAESKIQIPSAMVREVAAKDCIRLACDCFADARKHITEKKPKARSRTEDQLFSMKSEKLQKMGNTEGFWWYYLSQLEAGNGDFAAAVVGYDRNYFSKGKMFERPDRGTDDA